MRLSRDASKNREYWDRYSDEYQAAHGTALSSEAMAWGVWRVPESDLRVLGRVQGKDVLELGCGAAQWSVALALVGARPVGLDNSKRQLAHARRSMSEAGVDFPLVYASAERIPLPDRSFDTVLADHGAFSFVDPTRTLAESARLLRPGGLLAFCGSTPIRDLCWNARVDRVDYRLHADYFSLGRWEGEGHVEYQLPYGEWIRLFRRNGFVVEDLVELRPPERARTTYPDYVPTRWARRWPSEHIWKARRGHSRV
jgi:ubiquinone/menaquinone biosynthesis C-methylase UbiE